jgi:hypothetical protein
MKSKHWMELRDELIRFTEDGSELRGSAYLTINENPSKQRVRLAAIKWLESGQKLNRQIAKFVRLTAAKR